VSGLLVLPKVALAAILLASMWRAFFGAPAPEAPRLAVRVLAALAVGCYAGGGALFALRSELAGALLVVAGIEASCVVAWLARAARDDGGDDGGGGGGGGGGGRGPKLPPPIDWDAFDRARRAWERTPAAR
jgi:hypothetical protein